MEVVLVKRIGVLGFLFLLLAAPSFGPYQTYSTGALAGKVATDFRRQV
jgi:hypothetical protein